MEEKKITNGVENPGVERLYSVYSIIYLVLAIYISVKNLLNKEYLQAILGPVSLLFFLAIPLASKVFHAKFGYAVKLETMFFCTLAFQLGVALQWYQMSFQWDKITHFVSGIFFTQIGMCIYIIFRGDKARRTTDIMLQVLFAFGISMTIAVFWEICEFIDFNLTGHDAQNHLTTGVYDTMGDLIACFTGSLLMCLDFARGTIKKKRTLLTAVIREFDNLNVDRG